MDADVATDERSLSVRQRRVVLTPVCWRQIPEQLTLLRSDGGNRASAHRGERVISRKAIAQGRSGVHRCPVCSCAAFLALCAHETAGAARTRSSLRPLTSRAERSSKLGRFAPRDRERVFGRHCERSEAIHLATRRKNGLLRCARNDGIGDGMLGCLKSEPARSGRWWTHKGSNLGPLPCEPQSVDLSGPNPAIVRL